MTENKKGPNYRTTIGGQALIEGIMMLGPKKAAIVVNTPQGHSVKEMQVSRVKDKYPVLGLPLIRGMFNFYDSLRIGIGALMYSADFLTTAKKKAGLSAGEKGSQRRRPIRSLWVCAGARYRAYSDVHLFADADSRLPGKAGSGILRNLLEGHSELRFSLYLALVSRLDG